MSSHHKAHSADATTTAPADRSPDKPSSLDKPSEPGKKPVEQPATEAPPAATLDLPFLRARVDIPGRGIDMKAGPVEVSLPTRYLYYGGLGALTVAGAIEWPVAGALAATGVLVGRLRKPAAPEREPVGAGTAAK